MHNSLQRLADAFRPEYCVSFCLLSEDTEDADLILELADHTGIVAKRHISAWQRATPERLNNLIQSIRLGIAIDQRNQPAEVLASITLRD